MMERLRAACDSHMYVIREDFGVYVSFELLVARSFWCKLHKLFNVTNVWEGLACRSVTSLFLKARCSFMRTISINCK
jgi:hypothetical protein